MKNPRSVFVFHNKLPNDIVWFATQQQNPPQHLHPFCLYGVSRTSFYSVCRSITFQKSLTLLSWLEPGNISCPSFYFFIAEESTWGKDWNWCTLRHTNCNSTCITYTHWFITKYFHLTSNCITEATCSNVNSNTKPIQEYNLYYKFDLNYQQISEIPLSDLWPNILFLQICI